MHNQGSAQEATNHGASPWVRTNQTHAPEEQHEYGLSTNPVAYSMNPDHYQPRCVPCHKRYDLDRQGANAQGVA